MTTSPNLLRNCRIPGDYLAPSVDSSELTPRTFADYYATCERIADAFGKTRLVSDLASDDFEKLRASLSKGWGPVALGNEIQRVRVVFKYAYDAGLIDRPVRFGPGFKRPSRKVLRLERAKKGPRMFDAADLKKIVDGAANPLKAMILLGLNCGFGNADVANLPTKALDLKLGWVDYPRPKTGIPRRCPLWPETIDALTEAMNERPQPKEPLHEGLIFITRCGQPWQKADRAKALIAKFDKQEKDSDEKMKIGTDDPVCKEFSKLIKRLKLHRSGLGFYALRHTFETIGSESRDQVAVNYIMGHAPTANDMASVYRERISDVRLKAVTDHIHGWLFAKESKGNDKDDLPLLPSASG